MSSTSSLLPERYGSLLRPLLSGDAFNNLERASKRTASAMSQMSSTSSTNDFVTAKIDSITADLAVSSEVRKICSKAKDSMVLSKEQYSDVLEELESHVSLQERELVTLKRQKKMFVEDIEDSLPQYSSLEEAYSSVLKSKVMSACSKQKKQRKFDQSAYAKGVLSYYGAVRTTKSGETEKYCHLTGWQPDIFVKCAHLVPKSLESDELAYLFGARESVLSEPRNGITLNTVIEGGLDKGWMVIVPQKPEKGEETIWRCVLVDQSHALNMLAHGIRWKDIHNKPLEFLTPNRPARRYLYLRYVITTLQQKALGNTEWLENIDAKGHMWATPGPYLRRSMLLTLARRISDNFLPEAFYDSTFTVADGSLERSPEEEEDLAMVFDHKLQDAIAESKQDESDQEDSDSDCSCSD